jgi:hypothetical protein
LVKIDGHLCGKSSGIGREKRPPEQGENDESTVDRDAALEEVFRRREFHSKLAGLRHLI